MLLDIFDEALLQAHIPARRLSRRPAGSLKSFQSGLPSVALVHDIEVRVISYLDHAKTPPRAYVRLSTEDKSAWYEFIILPSGVRQ